MRLLLIGIILNLWVARPVNFTTSGISIRSILETVVSTCVPDHISTGGWVAESVNGCLRCVSTESTNKWFWRNICAWCTYISIDAKRAPVGRARVAVILSNPFERLSILINHDAKGINQVRWGTIMIPRVHGDQTLREDLRISENCLSYNHIIPKSSEFSGEKKEVGRE